MGKIQLDRAAHMILAKNARKKSDAAPVRSILMVGALEEDGKLGLRDNFHLQRTFDICAKNNLPIAKDVEVELMNLVYGDDYLADPPHADMIVLSYIFYCPDRNLSGMDKVHLSQSPHAGGTDAHPHPWHTALLKSNAQAVINVHGDAGVYDLPNKAIEHAPFAVVDMASVRPHKYFLLTRQPESL